MLAEEHNHGGWNMRRLMGLMIAGLLLGSGGAASAGPIEDAAAAYQRGDYATTLTLLRPLAEKGDVLAQLNLAGMYANGQGVEQSPAEAAKWLRMAAGQKSASAQNALGTMYYGGQGVEQDLAQAAQWFRMAAAQGHPGAQYSLGQMYRAGQGVPQDALEAVKWIRLAAEQGVTDAQLNLGVMYATGQGVAPDNIRAHMWFSVVAATATGEDARKATNNRNLVAAKMTPAQVTQAQNNAKKCQQAKFKNCG